MTIKGGTSQACAACKYRRRRCSKECVLASYFPADQPKMFQNAHRLFGVRNITRILEHAHDDQKDEAMRSIIYESDIRARSPVDGCLGVIYQLQFQIQHAIEELRFVNTQLAICKDQNCSSQYQMTTTPSPYYGTGVYAETNDHDLMELKTVMPQLHSIYNNNDMAVGSKSIFPQGIPVQQETEIDYDDMPLDDMIADDRQSYTDSKEPCDYSCAESSSTSKHATGQSMGHGTENELRNAAACLSLKSKISNDH